MDNTIMIDSMRKMIRIILVDLTVGSVSFDLGWYLFLNFLLAIFSH